MPKSSHNVYLTNVKSIKADSLAAKAAGIIRSMIIRNEFPPGMRLVEEEIAGRLGVSRACVREAYMALESEGLIQREINKYTAVVRFDRSDVEEIYKIRLAIEKLCVEACMDKGINPADELQEQANRIAGLTNGSDADYLAWVEEDKCFHEIIVRASGNKRALRIWSGISSQISTLLFSHYIKFPRNEEENANEVHYRIVEAFAKGNRGEVLSLLERHIMLSFALSLKCIDEE